MVEVRFARIFHDLIDSQKILVLYSNLNSYDYGISPVKKE